MRIERCLAIRENLIAQLGAGFMRSRHVLTMLLSNWAYMVMASLAWSLKAWFGLLLPEKGRWASKYKAENTHLGEEALARYVQGLLSPSRMLRFEMPDLSMARRPKESLMALMTARMQVEEMLPKAKTGYEQLGRAFEMQENVWFARCLLSAGILPDARSFRLPSADQRGVERLEERAASIVAAQLPFIEAWERNLRRRMTAALECLHHPKLFAQGEEHDAMVARAQELAAAQRELQTNLDDVLELRRHLSALELLGAQLSDENHQELIDQLGLMQNQAHEHLVASRDGLIYARHPFAGGDEEITIGMYLIERLPERRLALGRALFEVDAQLMTEVYEAGQIVGERYYSLYLRVLGALAAIAEKVESKAGLPPLPKVEPTDGPSWTPGPGSISSRGFDLA